MFEIIEKLRAFQCPMCKGWHVITAPSRSEVIGERLATVAVFDAQSMVETFKTCDFIDSIGVKNACENQRSPRLRSIGWVGITDETVAQSEVALTVKYYARSQLYGRFDAVIPHGHAVEMRAFVERNQPMFSDTFGIWGEIKAQSEPQRTVIQDAKITVTIRENQPFWPHQSRCSATQSGSNTVGIHAISVVKMKGSGAVDGVGLGIKSGFSQRIFLHIASPIVQISFGKHGDWRVFRPYIDAE